MLCKRYHFWCIPAQTNNDADALKWKLRGKVFPCSRDYWLKVFPCSRDYWLLALKKDEEKPELPKELKDFWSEVTHCATPCPRLCLDKNELVRCNSLTNQDPAPCP
jgi:hypothetical protein